MKQSANRKERSKEKKFYKIWHSKDLKVDNTPIELTIRGKKLTGKIHHIDIRDFKILFKSGHQEYDLVQEKFTM